MVLCSVFCCEELFACSLQQSVCAVLAFIVSCVVVSGGVSMLVV